MTDDDLLAQIAAAPDDDAPRAVFADLLLQRGDPRGEFIQLQLAHSNSDREYELLRAHEPAWTRSAGVRGAGASYHRGFIASLYGSPGSIVASREALRTQPIVKLSLEPDGELAALAELPELARIRSLNLRAQRLSPSEFVPLSPGSLGAIAAAPFSGLRVVELGGNAIDDHGAQALAPASWLPQLEQLTMWKCLLGSAGYDVLLPRCAALNTLIVDSATDGAACVAALVRCRPPLRSLSLKDSRLGGGAAHALAAWPSLAGVERLDLQRCELGDDACAFATSPYVGALRELLLNDNALEPAAGAAFGDSQQLQSLDLLALGHNRLGNDGVEALVRGRGLPALQRLVITGNNVTDEHDVVETRERLAARFGHRRGVAIS